MSRLQSLFEFNTGRRNIGAAIFTVCLILVSGLEHLPMLVQLFDGMVTFDVARASGAITFIVMTTAVVTGILFGNLRDVDGDGDIDGDDVRLRAARERADRTLRPPSAHMRVHLGAICTGIIVILAAGMVTACGGSGFTAPVWLPPAFDSVNVTTDGAADVDVTLGDLPLFRLKTDGAAEAGYDLREGPILDAQGCAQLYVGPFNELAIDTCRAVGLPEDDGDDGGDDAEDEVLP